MAISVKSARDSLTRLKKDLSDVSQDTFVEWSNFINRFIYREIAGMDPERYIDESNTYIVASDPQTNALPSDFRDITKVGTGFFQIGDDAKDTQWSLTRTGFGRKDVGYYIKGDNVIFTGINSGKTWRLRYIPELTTFTDQSTAYFTIDGTSTGVEVIPDEYQEYVVKALDVLYTQWDEEVGAESFADARFVRALENILDNVRKEPDAQQLDDFTIAY